FLEAIGRELLAAAGATVDKHGDTLAPLHVLEFAGAIAISDLHLRRSRVEQDTRESRRPSHRAGPRSARRRRSADFAIEDAQASADTRSQRSTRREHSRCFGRWPRLLGGRSVLVSR